MANEKEIIKKLIAIATKQQKIIAKLAQQKVHDPLEGAEIPRYTGNIADLLKMPESGTVNKDDPFASLTDPHDPLNPHIPRGNLEELNKSVSLRDAFPQGGANVQMPGKMPEYNVNLANPYNSTLRATLDPATNAAIAKLNINDRTNTVDVTVKPGSNKDNVRNNIIKAVTKLQQNNTLPAEKYNIVVV